MQGEVVDISVTAFLGRSAGETASGHAPVPAVGYIGFPGAMCAAGFLPLQLRTVGYF